jgi:hypothetical protein
MKFITIGPYVGSGAFDRVFVIGGVVRRAPCMERIANTGLIGERSHGSLLKKYWRNGNQKYNQAVHSCASCKIMLILSIFGQDLHDVFRINRMEIRAI